MFTTLPTNLVTIFGEFVKQNRQNYVNLLKFHLPKTIDSPQSIIINDFMLPLLTQN